MDNVEQSKKENLTTVAAPIAKLQIQPESGGLYICLVVRSFVETLRLSRQEQTRLSPDQTILNKARPDQTRPDQTRPS